MNNEKCTLALCGEHPEVACEQCKKEDEAKAKRQAWLDTHPTKKVWSRL